MRFFVLLALALSVAPGLAANDNDPFVKSGLAGTWAQDCSRPPSDGNWYDTYAIAKDGELTETLVNKPGEEHSVSVLSRFRKVSNKLYAYSMTQNDEDLNLVVAVEAERQRTWSSISVKNTVYIRNGKMVSDGSETVWFNRCKK